ncbi:MAG: tRNA pseudouridine(55) synthase TruB [Steroidobacteraceae bacterium]
MPSGILLLDKPRGLSSNAALQRLRSLFGREKAGHVGSLDPLATGMLPICLGEATKVAGDVLDGRKCYRFTVALGARTATGDTEGEVIATAAVPVLERGALEAVLVPFHGPQRQVPPMYSAIKQGGQPLYRLARAGVTVARAARDIELFALALTALAPASLDLEVLCSKGTYVRVLAEDIAAALGTCGHVTQLRRLYVEPFANQPMHTLESLSAARAAGSGPALLPADAALMHLPAVILSAAAAERLRHGQRVAADTPPHSTRVRLYDACGEFLGIGAADGSGGVQPRRLLNAAQTLSAR